MVLVIHVTHQRAAIYQGPGPAAQENQERLAWDLLNSDVCLINKEKEEKVEEEEEEEKKTHSK